MVETEYRPLCGGSFREEVGIETFQVHGNGKRRDGHPVTDAETVNRFSSEAGRVLIRQKTLDIREEGRGHGVPGDGTEAGKAEVQAR